MRGIAAFLIFAVAAIVQAEDIEPVDIGPFATEGWVEEKLEGFETITNGLASTEWVENKQYATESVTNGLLKVETDPVFTNWVASTNFVYIDESGIWKNKEGNTYIPALYDKNEDAIKCGDVLFDPVNLLHYSSGEWTDGYVTINPVTLVRAGDGGVWTVDGSVSVNPHEVTNAIATHVTESVTNGLASVNYVDAHKWDWSTQITNPPAFPTYAETTLSLGDSAFDLSKMIQGDKTNYFHSVHFDVNNGKGFFSFGDDGNLWMGDFGYTGPYIYDRGYRSLWLATNGVIKAGTVATVEDLAGFANKSYVDGHKWDWSTQVTNAPSFATVADATLTYVSTNWVFVYGLLEAAQANLSAIIPELATDSHLEMRGTSHGEGNLYPWLVKDGYHAGDEAHGFNFGIAHASADGLSAILDDADEWARAIVNIGSAIATRSTVSGYTLGSQTNKLLQPAGDYVDRAYVDDHQWDWSTQVTNKPTFALESIGLSPYNTAFTLRYEPNGSRTFYYDGTNSTVGLFMVDNKGDPYISACNGQSARVVYPAFFDRKQEGFQDIYGNTVHIDTSALFPTYFVDNSDIFLWLRTNGVLKAGTVATVEDLAGFATLDVLDGYVATNHSGKVRIYTPGSLAIGNSIDEVYADSSASLALGANAVVERCYGGMALGIYAHTTNQFAFVYAGDTLASKYYGDHGVGTFNVNPMGGLSGFWIGETNLATHIDSASKLALDAIAPAFSTSSVYTNGNYVIYDRHLYECTNYTGQAGWRANDWQQTTVTDILGNLRSILDAINGEAL